MQTEFELFTSLKSKKGFTLAEVLITLAIIGIVAALAIPGIITNIQDQQYNVGVQDSYSMLSQAMNQIQNNGAIHTDSEGLKSDFCNVLQCVQFTNTLDSGTFPTYYKYKNYSSLYTIGSYAYPAVILNNGYLLAFFSYGNCNNNNINACGTIYIDINGKQSPNMWGKDMYAFWIVLNNGIYSILPAGSPNDSSAGAGQSYSCAVNNWALGCTYLRLTNPNNMP